MTKSIFRVVVIVGLILLIPVFGNLYIEGWNWSPMDFVIMGTLMFIVGMAIDFAARTIADPVNKALAIGAILLAFLVLWAQMAVGAVGQLFALIF